MPFAKGHPKPKNSGGSRKNRHSHISLSLKAMILRALDVLGGEKYLIQQGKENPVAFLALLSKILPHELQALDKNGKTTDWTFVIRRADPVAIEAEDSKREADLDI